MRDGVERFGDRADLIQLHEQRVADAIRDAPPENLRVRHEHIVADQLDPAAELARQRLSSRPSRFRRRRPQSK